MRKICAATIISLLSFSASSYSADLEEFLISISDPSIKPADAVEMLNLKSEEEHQELCDAIKSQTYYKITESMKLGIFKRNALIKHCQSYVPLKKQIDVNSLDSDRYPKAKEKMEPSLKEVGKLNLNGLSEPIEPILNKKTTNKITIPSTFLVKDTLTQENSLKKTTKTMMIIEEQINSESSLELKEKIIEAKKKLTSATDNYDNMNMIVSILREDISNLYKHGQLFKNFNPPLHENDTNEEYLTDILVQADDLEKAKQFNSNEAIQQLEVAKNMLDQSKLELEEANKIIMSLND